MKFLQTTFFTFFLLLISSLSVTEALPIPFSDFIRCKIGGIATGWPGCPRPGPRPIPDPLPLPEPVPLPDLPFTNTSKV